MSVQTGFGFSGMIVVVFMLFIVFALLHIALCIWAYRDCLKRGKSQEFALIALVGMLFFPVMGLIIYLIIRND